MIKVIEKNKCFGILEDGKEVVPVIHPSKEYAIDEWVFIEKINSTENQFLDHKRTIEEIEKIENNLKNSKIVEKSPSQRLRNTLFIVHESNNLEGSFDDYYQEMMEKIINHFKTKIKNEY